MSAACLTSEGQFSRFTHSFVFLETDTNHNKKNKKTKKKTRLYALRSVLTICSLVQITMDFDPHR